MTTDSHNTITHTEIDESPDERAHDVLADLETKREIMGEGEYGVNLDDVPFED